MWPYSVNTYFEGGAMTTWPSKSAIQKLANLRDVSCVPESWDFRWGSAAKSKLTV